MFGRCNLWLRDDVLAYRDEKSVEDRPPYWMQSDLLFTKDVAKRMGVSAARIARLVRNQEWLRGRIPEPCVVGIRVVTVWWRHDVERFLEELGAAASDHSG